MTYKSKEFDLIYLNKQILQIIKESFGDYYLNNKDKKNINDFIDKLKKRFGDEYEKYKNYELNNNINDTNSYLEETEQNKLDNININKIISENLNKNKNILEFNFINFIQQFELSKIFPDNNIKIKSDKDNDNNIINTNEINLKFPSEYSNVNEYSNLNLTKDNIELVQRNIITSATRTTRTNLISKTSSKTNLITNSNRNINNFNNNNDINIYNNYGIFNTETRNLKTEEEKEEFPIDNNEPFKVDITSIQNNKMNSKDESEFKSILIENNKK